MHTYVFSYVHVCACAQVQLHLIIKHTCNCTCADIFLQLIVLDSVLDLPFSVFLLFSYLYFVFTCQINICDSLNKISLASLPIKGLHWVNILERTTFTVCCIILSQVHQKYYSRTQVFKLHMVSQNSCQLLVDLQDGQTAKVQEHWHYQSVKIYFNPLLTQNWEFTSTTTSPLMSSSYITMEIPLTSPLWFCFIRYIA